MGDDWARYCWNRRGHGTVDLRRGIADSCNVVFYELGYSFYQRDEEELQEYARRFGFASRLGIDLPGEARGRIPDAEWKADFNKDYPEYRQWLPGDTVNLAIGQGDMLVTPLQMTAAYAGIANGGEIMRPHVLKEVLDSKGETARTDDSEVAFSTGARDSDLSTMHSALIAVTEQGTATGAFRGFDERVAGKTGSAQVVGKDSYAWFAGYAPAEDPRYAVAVLIEQGGGGGAAAAPAARMIMAALLGLPVEHVTATDQSR